LVGGLEPSKKTTRARDNTKSGARPSFDTASPSDGLLPRRARSDATNVDVVLTDEELDFARAGAKAEVAIADVKRALAAKRVRTGVWEQNDAMDGSGPNDALYRALSRVMRGV
jgi:hypothetical protein